MTCFSVCFDMYMYVGFFSVNHRIVYVYVWFVSMCLCCIQPNKSYVVKKTLYMVEVFYKDFGIVLNVYSEDESLL